MIVSKEYLSVTHKHTRLLSCTDRKFLGFTSVLLLTLFLRAGVPDKTLHNISRTLSFVKPLPTSKCATQTAHSAIGTQEHQIHLKNKRKLCFFLRRKPSGNRSNFLLLTQENMKCSILLHYTCMSWYTFGLPQFSTQSTTVCQLTFCCKHKCLANLILAMRTCINS